MAEAPPIDELSVDPLEVISQSPIPEALGRSFLERHAYEGPYAGKALPLTAFVTRCVWTHRRTEPWTTIEATLVVPHALRSVLPDPGDVLIVRAPNGRPLAWGFVQGAPSSPAEGGPNGEQFSAPVTIQAVSWLVKLRAAQFFAEPSDLAGVAAGSPPNIAGRTTGVGTLFTADEWYAVVEALTGLVDGQIGVRLVELLGKLLRLEMPPSFGPGTLLSDVVVAVYDAKSSNQTIGDPNVPVEGLEPGEPPVLAASSIPIDPVLGKRLLDINSYFPKSTNILDFLLGIFRPDPMMIEFFETLEPWRVRESNMGRMALGAVPVLVYRIVPFRVEGFREWVERNATSLPTVSSQSAPGQGQTVFERAMDTYTLPTWLRSDTDVPRGQVLSFTANRSDTERVNAVTVNMPTGVDNPARLWRNLGLPLLDENNISRHGLRLYQVNWPFMPSDDAAEIDSAMLTTACMGAMFYLGRERFYSGTFRTHLRSGHNSRADIRVGRTIRFHPGPHTIEAYSEQVRSDITVDSEKRITGYSTVTYSRGAYVNPATGQVPAQAPANLTAKVRMPARANVAPTAATSPVSKLTEYGAWTGASADPTSTARRAKQLGINHLELVVNDASNDVTQGPIPWSMYDADRIRRAVDVYRAANIGVSLMSWITPRPDWITGVAEVAALCAELNVPLTLDVEEPWIVPLLRSTDAIIQEKADAVMASIRSEYSGPVGTTFIVFTTNRVTYPLASQGEYIIPQAYANAFNTGSGSVATVPGGLEKLAYQRHSGLGKEFIMGAAAGNFTGWLTGAYGTTDAALAAEYAVQGTLRQGVQRARYWRLEFFTGDVATRIRKYVA